MQLLDRGLTPAELIAQPTRTEEFNLGSLRRSPRFSLSIRKLKSGHFYGIVLKRSRHSSGLRPLGFLNLKVASRDSRGGVIDQVTRRNGYVPQPHARPRGYIRQDEISVLCSPCLAGIQGTGIKTMKAVDVLVGIFNDHRCLTQLSCYSFLHEHLRPISQTESG